MAHECDVDVSKIVTTFLLNTCRLPSRISSRDIQAAVFCAMITTTHPLEDEEAEQIPLITGSVAEFYVEPMLPHVGDIDVMYHGSHLLATPRGHPPPTELPAEFHNYVKVYEIIDTRFPGYVHLRLRYLLTECSDYGKYKYTEYKKPDDGVHYTYLLHYDQYDHKRESRHGPATVIEYNRDLLLCVHSVDYVSCLRCLLWPLQAAGWPARQRNYVWPDSATLDRVVSDGCDVVGVAHRQCRQDKRTGRCQWRLSFSRAEIVLKNTWMPVQQIVYHLLRYFVKTHELTDCAVNSGAGTLSNYHIKTLMLWACELKPRSWWTENLNLVRISVELLRTLSVWLTDTRCPHYFVNNCNLLDNSFNVGSVASKQLMSIDEAYLITWFINNYIRQCAQLCPDNVSLLFDDVSTSMKLQNAVSEVVCWRLNTSLDCLRQAIEFAESFIPSNVSEVSLTAHSCVCWMNELAKVDQRFSVYFSGIVLLKVACKVSENGGFNDELMHILSKVLGSRHNFNLCCGVLSLCNCNVELNTSELVELLLKSAVERLTTYRQLIARDFGFVVMVVTTDFEALYAYKRGDYQQCLQLSTQNVHPLLYAVHMPLPVIPIYPMFIQLFDDDLVSLTALTMIIDPEWILHTDGAAIDQLTLSLYLMTQCQLKLRQSVTSLAQTLDYIKIAQIRHPCKHTLDQLTLKLIERKAYRATQH